MSDTRTIPNDILLGEICQQLAEGKNVRLRAKGDSMRPFIRNGVDVILLSPPDSLKKGDIVLARIDDAHYVIHRIIRINGDEITLMGDANLYKKEKCRRKDIFGKATSLLRNGHPLSLSSQFSLLKATLWHSFLHFRKILSRLGGTAVFYRRPKANGNFLVNQDQTTNETN